MTAKEKAPTYTTKSTKVFTRESKPVKHCPKGTDYWTKLKNKMKSIFCGKKKPEDGWLELKEGQQKVEWKIKVPEIDWDAKPAPITPALNVDTTPCPLQEDAPVSVYHKTYTTFSGCDTVVAFNGKVMGELHSFKYDVDGDLKGDITLKTVLFERSTIMPNNTLAVVTCLNEYGNHAYQVFKLNKLKKYEQEISMDSMMPCEKHVYIGEVLETMKPMPEAVVEMPKHIFEDMVAKVFAKCKVKQYLPDITADEVPVAHLTNRMYFYYLYKNFCQEEA